MKKAYHSTLGVANPLDPTKLHVYSIQPCDNDYLIFELFDFHAVDNIFVEAVRNDRMESGQKMSDAGRRCFCPKFLGRIFLILFFRNWSYKRTAKEIRSNLCLRAWLRLGEEAPLPKHQTIWKYCQIFIRQKVFQKLLATSINEGKLVNWLYGHSVTSFDSTFVLAPIQRNCRFTWKEIREGKGEELWKDNPCKKIHKDIQAAFTKKNGIPYFGYKAHMTICLISKLIFDLIVTPASVHDAKTATELIERLPSCVENVDENGILASGSPCVLADAGYFAKALIEALARKGYLALFCSKAQRGKELTDEQKAENHEIAKVRCRIEHVFATLERSLGGLCVRWVGLERATAAIYAKAWVYNKMRLVLLSHLQAT